MTFAQFLHGLQIASTQCIHGFNMVSAQCLRGFHMASEQCLHGFHMASVCLGSAVLLVGILHRVIQPHWFLFLLHVQKDAMAETADSRLPV